MEPLGCRNILKDTKKAKALSKCNSVPLLFRGSEPF